MAKSPQAPDTLEAAAAKAEQAKATGKKKPVVKHLLENTTESKKDINFLDENGQVKTVSVPAAKFVGQEVVNGWAVVDISEIESMKNNAVIAAHFESRALIDAGETDAEVSDSTTDDETQDE
jgi:hypothetical protein